MASRSLGTLTLDLVAKVGGFEQGMDKAARSAEKNLSAIEKRAYQFGQALGTALKVGAGLAAAGLGAVSIAIKNTIDGLDELSKSAQKAGVSTEEFSKLAYAGELADVSIETLVGSLGKLTKAQAAALDETSKTAEVFEALGIAVKDADGNLRSSSDVLGDFAERFKELGGSPEAVAAGFQIFGRSFQELIPLLRGGREGIQGAGDELERFGGVVSTEAGQAAEQFNDNLTTLKGQFQAVFIQATQNVLPMLLQLSEYLKEASINGNLAKDAVRLLTGIFETGVSIANGYKQSVEGITIALGFLDRASDGAFESAKNFLTLGAAEGGFWSGLGQIKDAASAAADEAERLHQAAQQVRAVDPEAGGIDFTLGAPLTDKERAAQEAARLKALRDALAGTTEARKKDTKAKKDQTEAEKAWIDLQETYAEIEAQTAQFTTDRIIREGELAEQRRQNTADMLADIAHENELLGKTAEEQERINTLRWAGVDAASAEGQAITDSLTALQERRLAIEDQITAMDALRDAGKGFFRDIVAGRDAVDSLKDAFDSVINTILDAIAENLIGQFLGQAGTTSAGSAGGWWAQFAGMLFGGGRANGGPVSANTLYRVNERGPELLSVGGADYLMMGAQAGRVDPNPAMGGGITIQNTYVNPQLNDWRSESQRRTEEAAQLRIATARNGS
jgi:hypothetical protein